jgi:hypothetical protein
MPGAELPVSHPRKSSAFPLLRHWLNVANTRRRGRRSGREGRWLRSSPRRVLPYLPVWQATTAVRKHSPPPHPWRRQCLLILITLHPVPQPTSKETASFGVLNEVLRLQPRVRRVGEQTTNLRYTHPKLLALSRQLQHLNTTMNSTTTFLGLHLWNVGTRQYIPEDNSEHHNNLLLARPFYIKHNTARSNSNKIKEIIVSWERGDWFMTKALHVTCNHLPLVEFKLTSCSRGHLPETERTTC